MTAPGTPQLDVRRFAPGDGDRVRELDDAAMATTPEYRPDAPDDDLDAITEHYLDDADGEFLVGTLDDTIVATGAYTTPSEWKTHYLDIDADTTELTRMRTHPDHHDHGHGTTILHALERRAHANGYDRIVLDTGAHNHTARHFYETHDYHHQRTLDLELHAEPIHLALYQKRLAEPRPP